MTSRDPHLALKTEVIAQAQSSGTIIQLARLQWGKDDIGFSLHVTPNSFSTAGLQMTDFLGYLGFQHSGCVFTPGRQCYWAWADENFDVPRFGPDFEQAFSVLQEGQRDLEACGLFLDQPEGWGFFFGPRSERRSNRVPSMAGNGHIAATRQLMKESGDDAFQYKFTWLENGDDKGWVIHYRAKHPPLSSEIESAFGFLGLQTFPECPEYDFDPCYWRSISFSSRGDGFFDSNAQATHAWFDSHAMRFSSGVEKLLKANSSVESFGFKFLPGFANPTLRLDADVAKKTLPAKPSIASARGSAIGTSSVKGVSGNFDVAISFAGTERSYAEELATTVREAGYAVFYDDFFPEYLWGKNLTDTFHEIYEKRARFCVMFISKEYRERKWTTHERQSAQARALSQMGNEYILPIRIDDTELPGMPSTVCYIPITKGIKTIGQLLLKKLAS